MIKQKQKPERDTAVTLNDWIDYIQSEYGAAPEHPWADEPEFAVFRHESNRKWFALVMNIRRDRLLPGEDGIQRDTHPPNGREGHNPR